MDAERRQRIPDLFHQALARPTEERPAFLASACGSDDALSRELESLLSGGTTRDDLTQSSAESLTTDARPGATLGSYRLERILGRGGMATVFLAQDLKHRRRVAVKVLKAEVAAAIGIVRFLREIEIAAQLVHPHILPVFDSGAAGDQLYYVMPHVEGGSLRARLRREAPLPLEEALRLAQEVARALGHAHRQGFVHRDIKPENILLSDGMALVADFGIARVLNASDQEPLTGHGMMVGTPRYMSPEQVLDTGEVGPPADLYSLACVLYEMLAGEPPFTGTDAISVLSQHLLWRSGADQSEAAGASRGHRAGTTRRAGEGAWRPLYDDCAVRRSADRRRNGNADAGSLRQRRSGRFAQPAAAAHQLCRARERAARVHEALAADSTPDLDRHRWGRKDPPGIEARRESARQVSRRGVVRGFGAALPRERRGRRRSAGTVRAE